MTERPLVEPVSVIYALRDPRTDEVRYVGQARDPYRRLMNHLSAALLGFRKDNLAKDAWLRTLLLRHRLAPILEILEFVRGKPFAREREWINQLRSEGAPLLNGDTGAWARSPEGRARIRAANLGRKHSAATNAKRSASLKLAYKEGRRG